MLRIHSALTPAEWRRAGVLAAAVIGLNVLGWGTMVFAVAPRYPKVLGLGVGVLAFMLGLRHAFDADHIAAIDNTVRKLTQDGKAPYATGLFFSLGHSTIVVLASIAIAVTAAAATLTDVPDDLRVSITNAPGDEAYPISSFTWILVYKKPDDAAATTEALKFFAWSYAKGDDMAAALDYVPMPDAVVKSVEEMWGKDIVDGNGKPLYSGM